MRKDWKSVIGDSITRSIYKDLILINKKVLENYEENIRKLMDRDASAKFHFTIFF